MTPHFDSGSPVPRDIALPLARAYVAQLDWRLPWFRDRVAAAGGPPVDGSVESLDALASFAAARAHDPGPVTAEPFWFEPPGHRPDWTEAGAEWVEGLAAVVAEVITAATGARWVFDSDPRYVTGHQPVLQGVVNTPQRLASLAVADSLSGRTGRPLSTLVPKMIDQYARGGRLADAPDLGEADGPRAAAAPPPAGPVTVEVTPLTGGPWDVQVSLPEEVEDLLGAAAYASLEERFAAVPGVRAVVFEDRDVAVLATDGLDPEELRRALDGVLAGLRAAGGAGPGPAR
ncbi:hypothetical protein [Nocardioides mesophilus]|uniref:Uncharacterized protein n=1 Tax=Nocardioides mesophilus TaxID=433659 RepID=A0A7G9RBE9_9ACTN|nr:hypothetical protein [Nocardioides mesophilus]QNN52924.1 hypothetical protein H9L09_21335 [Nocardioides mesophilus]